MEDLEDRIISLELDSQKKLKCYEWEKSVKVDLMQNHTNRYETIFVVGEKSTLKEAFISELRNVRKGENATPYDLLIMQHGIINSNFENWRAWILGIACTRIIVVILNINEAQNFNFDEFLEQLSILLALEKEHVRMRGFCFVIEQDSEKVIPELHQEFYQKIKDAMGRVAAKNRNIKWEEHQKSFSFDLFTVKSTHHPNQSILTDATSNDPEGMAKLNIVAKAVLKRIDMVIQNSDPSKRIPLSGFPMQLNYLGTALNEKTQAEIREISLRNLRSLILTSFFDKTNREIMDHNKLAITALCQRVLDTNVYALFGQDAEKILTEALESYKNKTQHYKKSSIRDDKLQELRNSVEYELKDLYLTQLELLKKSTSNHIRTKSSNATYQRTFSGFAETYPKVMADTEQEEKEGIEKVFGGLKVYHEGELLNWGFDGHYNELILLIEDWCEAAKAQVLKERMEELQSRTNKELEDIPKRVYVILFQQDFWQYVRMLYTSAMKQHEAKIRSSFEVIPRKDAAVEVAKAIDNARVNSFDHLIRVLRAETKNLGSVMNKEFEKRYKDILSQAFLRLKAKQTKELLDDQHKALIKHAENLQKYFGSKIDTLAWVGVDINWDQNLVEKLDDLFDEIEVKPVQKQPFLTPEEIDRIKKTFIRQSDSITKRLLENMVDEYFGSNTEKRLIQVGLLLFAVFAYFAYTKGGTAFVSAMASTVIFVIIGVSGVRNKVFKYINFLAMLR